MAPHPLILNRKKDADIPYFSDMYACICICMYSYLCICISCKATRGHIVILFFKLKHYYIISIESNVWGLGFF